MFPLKMVDLSHQFFVCLPEGTPCYSQLVTMFAQKHGQLEHHHGFFVKSSPQADVNTHRLVKYDEI